MNAQKFNEKLATDVEHLCGFDLKALDSDVEFSSEEWMGLEIISRVLPLVYQEADLLRQHFGDDADVAYVLQAIRNEGAFYTLVHKLNVDVYTGSTSTMAGYARLLRGANILIKTLIK